LSGWFSMLGEPLSEAELHHLQQYLRGLAIDEPMPVQVVADWPSAGRAIVNPSWDRRWWDAEQRERARLYTNAAAIRGEGEVLESLSRTLGESTDVAHGSAAVAAARGCCTDAALIRAAAGALSQALYLGELAVLAGENDRHPFLVKQALFAGGHWPLGIVSGQYYVF
jgi:hypothetical protein